MTPEEMRAAAQEIITEDNRPVEPMSIGAVGISTTIVTMTAEICERLDAIRRALEEK